MKLAHLADLHLGFRQYSRQTSGGINQREADVAGSFRRALDDVISCAPDLVVVAGDLFHSVRPTNAAILDSFNQFRRLRDALPEAPLVIVAGNHDTPRSVETGTILKLFEAVDGVHVVWHEPQRLVFEQLDTAVLCVPNLSWSTTPRPAIGADPGSRRNILVTHREVEGIVPRDYADPYGAAAIRETDLHAREFDYVALGHYHVPTEVAPNVRFAGALEYVTTNPWGESRERGSATTAGEKGWLLVELDGEVQVEFRAVERARRVIDLEPIHGGGCSATELSQAIRDRAAAVDGGIQGQIVRQVVYDVPRVVARDLDHAAIREMKSTALHYRLDLRRPEVQRDRGAALGGRRHTLTQILEAYLEHRAVPAGVSRDQLVALGRRYIQRAEHELPEA